MGGSSGLSAAEVAKGSSCVAYVTEATANERCCIFTAAALNSSLARPLVADPSATLHLQVSSTDADTNLARSNNIPEYARVPSACPSPNSMQSGDLQLSAAAVATLLPHVTTKALVVGGAFVVGEFLHRDGRTAVMIQNFDVLLSTAVCRHLFSATAVPSFPHF